MDLNDPRKRLQVLNSQSPSLRVATAPSAPLTVAPPKQVPQQSISIAQPQANAPTITVPKTTPIQVPQAQPNQYKGFTMDQGKNKTIFGWNAAALLPKSLEKTYGVKVDHNITANNSDDFLSQYDKLGDDFKKVYTNQVLDQAKNNDPVAQQTLKLLQDSGRTKGNLMDFAEGANDKLYGGISRGFLRGVDFVLPGHNTGGLEQLANEQDPSKTGTQQFTTAGKVGEHVGSAEKGVFDVATLVAGGGATEAASKAALIEKFPGLAENLQKLEDGGVIAKGAAKIITRIPSFAAETGIQSLQQAGTGEKQNWANNLKMAGLTEAGSQILGPLLGKGIHFLRGGDEGAMNRVLAGLAKTDDQEVIGKVLNSALPEADDATKQTLAKYISTERDPQVIKQVLDHVSADTATTATKAAADTLPVFDPSHPSQQYLNDNIPGTHVPGTPDPTQVISDKAKSFASPDEFSSYVNSLTGEEKAVADSALAGKTPEEFYGAVNPEKQAGTATAPAAADLPEEDVAAIKAAGGTIPGDATDAGTVLHLPDQGVHAKLTPEQAAILADENKNIPWTADDRPHLTAGQRVLDSTREVSPEEIGNLSPNAKTALENANKQIADNAAAPSAQAVEDVSKAQTGTSEGQVTGSGETTNVQPAQGDLPSTVDTSTANGTNTPTTAENGSQGNLPQKAEDIAPNADPESKKAIQEVLDNLNSAQSSYDTAAAARTTEKGQRIGAGAGAYESAGGGEAGVKAKLGALKGKYSESGFNPITASEGTQKTILDNIENSNLRDFEKLNTQQAMRKIWGSTEGKPTPSDINYIRKFFGEDMANSVQQAVDESPTGWRDKLAQIAGTPRALMATGDLSYGLRQGAPLGARYPKDWAVAQKDAVKYAVNKDYFDRAMTNIKNNDAFETITSKMGVQLPAAQAGTEEAFAGADLAEKIPGVKHVVSGADRAYSGMATDLRFKAAMKPIEAAGGTDAYLKVMQDTFGDKADAAMKAYGEVLNTLSGRGGKAGGLVEQHMKTLSTTLFAPRLWAAKLNTLNPYWYARLAKDNPAAAKLAVRANATFLAMAGTVLSAAGAAGADVEWDPRSADFAKIKVGNTRYDILGGLQQNIRLAAQEITGTKINSETGQEQTLGDGFGKPTRKDILLQAFESKENPLLAYAGKLLDGKDQSGNPVNPVTEGAKMLIPLNAQGVYETAKDLGNGDPKTVAKGAAMNIPGVFGIGVQTYGQTASKDQGKDSTGKLVFKGKVAPNMVTDDSGQVMLDGKGKPIVASVPKGADGKTPKWTDLSSVEQKALLDTAKKSALKDQFTQKQSADDQALMKLSSTQLQKYVDDGTIDQSKFDKIQRLQKGAGDYGQEIAPDKGVSSAPAQAFSKHFNSMDKTDQDYFLNKQGPDSTATAITTELNKSRSANLDEYKPSNKLAQLYTKYEADINNHKDGADAYTDVDLRNKAKAFQTSAYKMNYSSEQNDIFSEGGSADLKTLIDNKEIDKADLDAAMKMDEQLYNSGLTGSLKFSKKFRESYGYNVPDGGSGPNGGGDSSSSNSINQHLLDYLPTQSAAGSGTNSPSFSSKRRTTGISFKNVNLPSKSGKKVTIKL